jgi:HEAT repeat protein
MVPGGSMGRRSSLRRFFPTLLSGILAIGIIDSMRSTSNHRVQAQTFARSPEPINQAIAPEILLLLKQLQSSNPEDRSDAIAALLDSKQPPDVLIPYLLPSLKDIDPDVRIRAIALLAKLGESVQILPLIKDSDNRVGGVAEFYLARMGESAKPSVPQLILMLQDPNIKTRKSAIYILGNLGAVAQSAVPQIIPLINDRDAEIRRRSVFALGKMGKAAKIAVPGIALLLSDPDRQVRYSAVSALQEMGEFAKILPALHDTDSDVRKMARLTFWQSEQGAKLAIVQILPLLQDTNANNRRNAIEALGLLGKSARAIAPKLHPFLQDPNPEIRLSAAIALGQMGDVQALPDLKTLLNDHDPFFQITVAEIVGNLGESEVAITHILHFLDNPSPVLRSFAVKALGNMGESGKRAIPNILPLLKDPVQAVRIDTVVVLEQLEYYPPEMLLKSLWEENRRT